MRPRPGRHPPVHGAAPAEPEFGAARPIETSTWDGHSSYFDPGSDSMGQISRIGRGGRSPLPRCEGYPPVDLVEQPRPDSLGFLLGLTKSRTGGNGLS